MKKILSLGLTALCLTATLLMTGCKTAKKDKADFQTSGNVLTDMDMRRAQAQRVQTKMQMALRSDEHHFTVGGNLKMERGRIVQLSIMPFGLVEVGVIEFTPEYMLMLYKTGHQYVKARYQDIELLKNNGIDFNAIQALFWGELFAPGRKSYSMTDFDSNTTDRSIVLSTNTSKDIVARFMTSLTGGILQQTQITSARATANSAMLNWRYDDYMRVGKGEMPSIFELSIDNIDRPVSCRFTLSKLKIDPEWPSEMETKLDKRRYQEVPFNTILTRLLNF